MKKILCLILVSCMCYALVGCGTKYEDTNGTENFTLQTITDENIIKLETGSSGLSYSEENLGDVVHMSEYSSKNFNGVEEIYSTNYIVSSDVRVYIGHMNVKSGNFKLVAINNEQIIHEFDLETFGEEFYFEDITGTFSIHVAGESAAFNFYIEVN